jgi:hypothetical protein
MTRPIVRPHTRKRCNLALGLHRLNCRGHAGKTGGATRSESQKARREAEGRERRSAAQAVRRESEKRGPNPGLSLATMRGYSEGPNRGQTSVDKRPLRPLARVEIEPAVLPARIVRCSWCPATFSDHAGLAAHNMVNGYNRHDAPGDLREGELRYDQSMSAAQPKRYLPYLARLERLYQESEPAAPLVRSA